MLDLIYDYAWKKNFNLDLFYKENKEIIDSAEFQNKELAILKDICTIEYSKNHKFDSCIICFTELNPQEKVIELPKCQHIYHYECLEPWIKKNNKCPICKGVIRFGLLSCIHEKVRDKSETAVGSLSLGDNISVVTAETG